MMTRVDEHAGDNLQRMAAADALVRKGDLDAAFDGYLWLWDHGKNHDPAFIGVRASFLVERMASVGKRHPPAQRVLEERRDELQRSILAGDVRFAPVSDLVALARVLATPQVLTTVLAAVPEASWQKQGVARRLLVSEVVDHLVAAREYTEAMRVLGDPLDFLAHDTRVLETPSLPDAIRSQMAANRVAGHARTVEACFATRDERTSAFVTRLLALDGSTTTWLMVLNAAKRAGNDVACHDYAARALQELPASEHEAVRGFVQEN